MKAIMSRYSRWGKFISVGGAAMVLVACTAAPTRDRYNPNAVTERQEPNSEQIAADASIDARERQRKLRELLESSTPQPDRLPSIPVYNPLEEIKVDLVVEDGELQYVLKALAAQAGLNLIVHPNLMGSPYRISLEFHDVKASTVLEQVSRIADVAVEVEGNTLIVNPMEENVFNLGFMETSTQNSFSTGGDVLGGSRSGGGGSGGSGGGDGQIKGAFTYSGSNMPNSNPYDQLDAMLQTLVGNSSSSSRLSGSVTGASSIAEITELSRLGTAIRSDLPTYSLNRITGTLFVRAKPSVMGTVTRLISDYEKILGGQILIDAQMIEVKLNDSFRFGVDWSSLRRDIATAFTASSRVVSGVTGDFGDLSQGTRTITISGNSLSAGTDSSLSWNRVTEEGAVAVDMMQKYGDVAVLSNPTIRSKHGQAAIISVGTSSTYVSDTRVVTTGASGTAITSQEIQTSQVFDGLMVGIVPFIDAEGNISLSVHPVQSRVDPTSLQLVDAGGDTKVTLPVVDLKTMVTQLKVHSGDAVILGGLIDQMDSRADSEVPGLGRIPLIGNLFKKRNNQNSLRELVIVLKVTML